MLKTKLKFFTFILVTIILLSSFSFAENTETTTNDIMPISAPIEDENADEETTEDESAENEDLEIDDASQVSNAKNNDVYTNNKFEDYKLEDSINGNVFVTSKNFTLDPRNGGGMIQGNLFVTAGTVSLQSDTTYSSDKKDDEGEPAIEGLTSASVIGGNAYIIADKFVLEPGCEIGGDLYVVANEIEISPYASIYGSVYVIGDTIKLNGTIYGDLYGICKNFEMKYYGCITRDLHLTSNNVILNGIVYANSFIKTENLVSKKDFMNHGNFELINSSSAIILGDFKRKC